MSARRPLGTHRAPAGAVAPWLAAALLACATPAAATMPAELCTGNPCRITRSATVDAGSTLDFGPVELRIGSRVRLTVGGFEGPTATVVLRARSIVLEPGASIVARQDNTNVALDATEGQIRLLSAAAVRSSIDVSGGLAGTIQLTATDDIAIEGRLDAGGDPTLDEPGAGFVFLESIGGSVVVTGILDIAAPSRLGAAGEVLIAGASVFLDGEIRGDAGSGSGTVSLIAKTGDVEVRGPVRLNGRGNEGPGGALLARAPAGGVAIFGKVSAVGSSGENQICGHGGTVELQADEDVTLSAPLSLRGGRHCVGGELFAEAGGRLVQEVGARIRLDNEGDFGGGGDFIAQSGGDMVLRDIELDSAQGGILEAVSRTGTITLSGVIDLKGLGAFGIGGRAEMAACSIVIDGQARLDARSALIFEGAGFVLARASRLLRVEGTVLASDAVELRHRATPPLITGFIDPPPRVVVDPTVPLCRATPVCGDGIVEGREVCDDANTTPCDGCAADCSHVDPVCGDAIVECGEVCDDGNHDTGDGCEADCRPGVDLRRPGEPLEAAGCLAEWMMGAGNAVLEPGTGFAAAGQVCRDGDEACDADGEVNDLCAFEVRACLRVPEPILPSCTAGPIDSVTLKQPKPGRSRRSLDDDNAVALVDGLGALGATVKVGQTVILPGAPVAIADACTPPIRLGVPTAGAAPGTRRFDIAARDQSGMAMKRNRLALSCASGHDRIPGGGAPRARDCALEWVVRLQEGAARTDRNGIPTSSQSCRDGDPLCDLDPTRGTCRFSVGACVGAADTRIGCPASHVVSARVERPATGTGKPADAAARASLEKALASLDLSQRGERCTPFAMIDVPVAAAAFEARVVATLASGEEDADRLQLRCLRR